MKQNRNFTTIQKQRQKNEGQKYGAMDHQKILKG